MISVRTILVSAGSPAQSPRCRFFARYAAVILVAAGLSLGTQSASAEENNEAEKSSSATEKKTAEKKGSAVNDTKTSDPEKNLPEQSPFPQKIKVPLGILDGGKGWLNATGPITVRDLKGKIVILDFWTYCCINCMHVLPELKAIERKYPNEVVVIGVHSAKFENEKDSENIRRAVQRYEIEHPVVNDAEMTIWQRFGTRSWPTLSFIDPEGYFLGSAPGEAQREMLIDIVDKLIKYHKKKGTLDETPVHFNLESQKLEPTPLRFPGKLLADEAGNRLFISDSNHNRIVISTLDGKLIDVVGNGSEGAVDGNYDQASFNHPQGMTLVGEMLYLADTENHLIRTIDLNAKTVATLAGTGKQARRRVFNWKLRETALNSPWALEHFEGTLYIAMAGPHQIWHHKLGSETIQVYAGSGREDIVDGSLSEAALAQPSGIISDGQALYITDSEGSSIRKIPTDPQGEVSTVVGTAHLPSGRLFAFGDVDGLPPNARLQHPIGITYYDGNLYVADSYNHKVKKVSLGENEGETTTFLGDGTRGDQVDPPRFSEPEGLTAAAGKLFIADTNNHRIGVADLKSKQFSILTIEGLTPPSPPKEKAPAALTSKKAEVVALQSLASAESLKFQIELSLPEDFKLNKLAPLTYRLAVESGQQLFPAEQLTGRHKATSKENRVDVTVPLAAQTGEATILLSLSYGYCRDGVGGLCKIKTSRWRIPLTLSADGTVKIVKLKSVATK